MPTDQPVFTIYMSEVEQFLNNQGYPPLTADERSNLIVAFLEGLDQDPIIYDAIRYLRGDECGVVDDEPAAAL